MLHWPSPYKPYKTCSVQMLVIFHDFCQNLSAVTLAVTQRVHDESMKSQNVIFPKNTEKIQTLAKC